MPEQLSPQAVEALAKALATKLEGQIRVADNLVDTVRALEREVASLQRDRFLAGLIAVVAIIIAALMMFSVRNATHQISSEIQELKKGQAKIMHGSRTPAAR